MEHIVIIGGGASGLIAAINAKSNNNEVTILERNSLCGKKILVTGNGRCNYWNIDQDLNHYYSRTPELLKEIITEQNKENVLNFFNKLGIYPKIKNGYYYPNTNQAITIRDALIAEVKRKGINIKTNVFVEKIVKVKNIFNIYFNNEQISATKLIIATGSKAAPKTGSTGSGYQLLSSLNHRYINPLPALVQLKTTGSFLKQWAGIRTDVNVSIYEDSNLLRKETGEIQLTDYGVSGICIFNLSRYASIGLANNKKMTLKIDFLPFINQSLEELTNYFKTTTKRPLREELCGILNSKLVDIILKASSINTNNSFIDLDSNSKTTLFNNLTNFSLTITGTNSFEQAQVCTGGIPLTDINVKTMESKLTKNLYIVGELLDVDGDCGGYNLSFAWISGMLAGKDCKNDKN